MEKGKGRGEAGPDLFRAGIFIELLTRYSDILLAALVIMIVSMMILPLPTFLIDILLTLNISISVVILLVSLYIPGALHIASFPSILLITTLFRLALNVSTTRLVLLQADAGEVIRAFGNFVVQGNMVVGGVIFLILTLINFIVISKGSERVAEVAARFTLDAMPGKQMSIDADLRAGSIDLQEAKRHRRELERESQLFGAMDGAMKFVKGDAIAGMIITVINIVGGVIIGVMMRQMNITGALSLYGLLTIGDGLVSQIPALIISTSAGLIVTRVAPESAGDHLGRDIGVQFLAYPKAIGITSGLLFGLGLVPGLPTLPFWTLSALTGLLAAAIAKSRQTSLSSVPETGADPETPEKSQDASLSLPIPVAVVMGREVFDLFSDGNDVHHGIQSFIASIKEQLYLELGVRLPGIRVQADESGLEARRFAIFMTEIPVYSGRLDPTKAALTQPPEDVQHVIETPEPFLLPEAVSPMSLIPIEKKTVASHLGFETLEPLDIARSIITCVLRKHAHEFIGIQEIKWMCDELAQFYPDTVSETVPRIISYRRLSDVCSRLVQEMVSIRDFRRILEILADFIPVEKDVSSLVELVRMRLGRQITAQFQNSQGSLPVYLIDMEIEDLIRDSVQQTPTEKFLAIDSETAQRIIDAFETGFQGIKGNPRKIVLTLDSSIRHVLWRFLNHSFRGISVISVQELDADSQLLPLGRISF